MLDRPSISYIMPAYNAGATILELLTSIVDGNFRSGDEIVVVDDCSSDTTRDIVESLAAREPGVRLVRHQSNKGGGAARNTAVRESRHDLVFCLDSDNVLAANSVDKLARFLCESRADGAAFREVRFVRDSVDRHEHSWFFRPGQTTLADYLATAIVAGASGNYLYRRESWTRAGGYPESSRHLDAWGFGLRQVATGQRIMVMDDGYYLHRFGHESYWSREARAGRTSKLAMDLIRPYLDQLEPESVAYLSRWHARADWFELLDQRPLRLRGGETGRPGEAMLADGTPMPRRRRNMLSRIVRNVRRQISHRTRQT